MAKQNAVAFLKQYIPKDFVSPDFTTIEGRDAIIDGLRTAARAGLLSPSTILGAQLGNFGAINTKNAEGKAVLYLTRDGKTYVDKDSEEYQKAFDDGNLVEKFEKGGLFYAAKDPRLLELIKIAEENYKGETIVYKTKDGIIVAKGSIEYKAAEAEGTLETIDYSQLTVKQVAMKFLLDLQAKPNLKNYKQKTEIVYKDIKRIRDERLQDVRNNQAIVKKAFLDMKDAIDNGANFWVFARLAIGMYQSTRGAIKASYEFKGFESGSHKSWREEHSPPVNEFAGNLISGMFTLNRDLLSQRIDDMYKDVGQYLISVDAENFNRTVS